MNGITSTSQHVLQKSTPFIDKWAKTLVHKLMSKLQFGQIIVQDGTTCKTFGKDKSLLAKVFVKDSRFYRKVLFGGSIGAGEGYVDNLWDVDDLTALVRIMVLNMRLLDKMERGFAWLMSPFNMIFHRFNRNSPKGSKKNILSHYDLGNDMYKSFLDPTMMYSSGIFENDHSTLEEASLNKLNTICEKLELKPEDHVVEIGAGWCGFAIYAARNYGCHVTTTTISDAQFQEGRQRIIEAGLENKVTLLKQDYRELTGQFDKLVSIEMIEAVGHQYHNQFFQKCMSLLKPDGKLLIQAITIADQKYDQYLRGVDFIQRHIFPGGCVPSNTRMLEVLTAKTDMVVRSITDFGFDYAQTLDKWRKRFNRAAPDLRGKGYDETFQRLWNFYLCYCQGGFQERAISVVHLVATRPENRE